MDAGSDYGFHHLQLTPEVRSALEPCLTLTSFLKQLRLRWSNNDVAVIPSVYFLALRSLQFHPCSLSQVEPHHSTSMQCLPPVTDTETQQHGVTPDTE